MFKSIWHYVQCIKFAEARLIISGGQFQKLETNTSERFTTYSMLEFRLHNIRIYDRTNLILLR